MGVLENLALTEKELVGDEQSCAPSPWAVFSDGGACGGGCPQCANLGPPPLPQRTQGRP
jgi:hypothetical protein